MRIVVPRDLGLVARGRRLDLGWSQAHLAEVAQVSRRWVTAFEHGKSAAELGLVLRVLDTLDLAVHVTPVTDQHAASELDLDAYLATFSDLPEST